VGVVAAPRPVALANASRPVFTGLAMRTEPGALGIENGARDPNFALALARLAQAGRMAEAYTDGATERAAELARRALANRTYGGAWSRRSALPASPKHGCSQRRRQIADSLIQFEDLIHNLQTRVGANAGRSRSAAAPRRQREQGDACRRRVRVDPDRRARIAGSDGTRPGRPSAPERARVRGFPRTAPGARAPLKPPYRRRIDPLTVERRRSGPPSPMTPRA